MTGVGQRENALASSQSSIASMQDCIPSESKKSEEMPVRLTHGAKRFIVFTIFFPPSNQLHAAGRLEVFKCSKLEIRGWKLEIWGRRLKDGVN